MAKSYVSAKAETLGQLSVCLLFRFILMEVIFFFYHMNEIYVSLKCEVMAMFALFLSSNVVEMLFAHVALAPRSSLRVAVF